MQGREGKGKPIDQLIEHYNTLREKLHVYMYLANYHFFLYRVIKQTMRSSGANVTSSHITEVSLAALFLLEAAKKTDKELHVTPQSQTHTVRDAADDIMKITLHLTNKSVMSETPDRRAPQFVHPTQKG